MKAELIPMNGDPPIPITRDVTVVGRREYCDVRIPHETISKRHCVIVRTDGLLMLRDLATTNGTKVNGQRIMWAALLPNDRLTIGGYKVRIYLGPDDAPSPSETVGGPVRAESPMSKLPIDSGFEAPTPTPEPATRPAVRRSAPLMDEDEVVMLDNASLLDLDAAEDDDEDDLIDLD